MGEAACITAAFIDIFLQKVPPVTAGLFFFRKNIF
jgi:hypothetical protein